MKLIVSPAAAADLARLHKQWMLARQVELKAW